MRLYEHRKTVLAKEKCKRQKGKESTSKGGRRCVCTSKGNGKGEVKSQRRAKEQKQSKERKQRWKQKQRAESKRGTKQNKQKKRTKQKGHDLGGV